MHVFLNLIRCFALSEAALCFETVCTTYTSKALYFPPMPAKKLQE